MGAMGRESNAVQVKAVEDLDRFQLVRQRSEEKRYGNFVTPIQHPERRTNFSAQYSLFVNFSFQRLQE
jgi:hypothetical protein